MSLPEDFAKQLAAKVGRINVLQKLVLQERISLKAKGLGDVDILGAINEEVRGFLRQLLERELGLGAEPTTGLSQEKLKALDTLLDKLSTRTSRPTPPIPLPSDGVPSENAPLPAPRKISPVMEAVMAQVGGEDAWRSLPADERTRMVKELQAATRASGGR
jgi:hypothetical protein